MKKILFRFLIPGVVLTSLAFLSIAAAPGGLRKLFEDGLGAMERYYDQNAISLYEKQPVGWNKKIVPMSSVFYAASRAVRAGYKTDAWNKTEAFSKNVKKAVAAPRSWRGALREYGPRFIRIAAGKKESLRNGIGFYRFILRRMDYRIFQRIQEIRKCCPSYDIYKPQGRKLMKELHADCKRKGMPLPPITLRGEMWMFEGGKIWSTYHLNEWTTFMNWVARRADAAGVKNRADYRRFKRAMMRSMNDLERLL